MLGFYQLFTLVLEEYSILKHQHFQSFIFIRNNQTSSRRTNFQDNLFKVYICLSNSPQIKSTLKNRSHGDVTTHPATKTNTVDIQRKSSLINESSSGFSWE